MGIKMEWNKKNIRITLGIISFAVLLSWGINNYMIFFGILDYMIALIFPFILGACIAFIVNVPMKMIEKQVLKWSETKRGRFLKKCYRIVSLILTILFIISLICLIFFLVIPEVASTVVTLKDNIQPFYNETRRKLATLVQDYPNLVERINEAEINWESIGNELMFWLRDGAGSVVSSTFNVASTVVKGVVNAFLGIVFAVYALAQKEKLGVQAKKLLYSFCPKKKADTVVEIAKISNRTFSNFLAGQCLEACILGFMFFVVMSILRFPYAMVISVVISLTALIPLFGAFIGCILGMFLIVMVNPMQAVWFLVLFLILQQVEGNLVYPRVVGNSVGLPSIWVLVAVTLGGSTMGVVGMLIFIPGFSIGYALLRTCVKKRLAERKIKL